MQIERYMRETTADQAFVDLLDRAGISLVASLRPGHVACIGAQHGRLTTSFTPILTPLGVATDGSRLAIGMQRQIVIYTASSSLGQHMPGRPGHHDAVFVPVASYRTGECMVHDMVLDGPNVVFANTQFSCLSHANGCTSFATLWQPSFISEILPEDRCHLNSFAMDGRRVRYATAFAASDTQRGYRTMPPDSGIIIDVEANKIVAVGLRQPHSVRVFDNTLYVLNSAAGEVLRVDLAASKGEVLASLPGFTRGLRVHDDVLFVGLSTLRATARSSALPLADRQGSLVTGFAALDRRSGELLGMLRLPAGLEEVFDFVVIPGVRQALVLDSDDDAVRSGIETPAGSFWMMAPTQQPTEAELL